MSISIGIAESSNNLPLMSMANRVGDAAGGRWPVGRWWIECVNCRDSCLLVGMAMSTVEHNYVIIDGEGKRDDEIKGAQ